MQKEGGDAIAEWSKALHFAQKINKIKQSHVQLSPAWAIFKKVFSSWNELRVHLVGSLTLKIESLLRRSSSAASD